MIFIIIYIYLALVVLLLLACAVLGNITINFEPEVEENIRYWEKVWKRCQTRNEYKLSGRQIRKLNNHRMMPAFYEFFSQKPTEEFEILFAENKEGLLRCVRKNRSKIEKAYFAYMLSSVKIKNPVVFEGYDELMTEYLGDNGSVYMRENALKALYAFGNVEKVVEAFVLLGEEKIYHNEKLLSDGLLLFDGDGNELAQALMERFDELSEEGKIATVDFLAHRGDHRFDGQLMERMLKEEVSHDLQCCIVRVVGKQKTPERKQFLLKLTERDEEQNWEVLAVTVNMLKGYEHDADVEAVLCKTLTAKNWYVRMNSAKTLVANGISEENRQKIQNGSDGYAKEALAYALRG